jgi:cytochrome c peroxidase
MSLIRFITAVFFLVLFGALYGGATAAAVRDYGEYFSPLPRRADTPANRLTPEKVKLGKMLFFDPRLSKSSLISCNTCHNLSSAGVDNLPVSIGHGWQRGERNAPTVLNAAILGALFRDGRVATIEEQAEGHITNPVEMASSEGLVKERLSSIPEYVELFEKAFRGDKDPVSLTNAAKALAAFERTLLTPSRFDRFLKGKSKELTDEEIKGLDLFMEKGCAGCHRGPTLGGDTFERFDHGPDRGRYNVTGSLMDEKLFRVSPLRNVELTYPYFHDGSVWTLEEAVRIMAEKQLRITLTDEESGLIASFLRSLTGRTIIFRMPALPPSTLTTPLPDPS